MTPAIIQPSQALSLLTEHQLEAAYPILNYLTAPSDLHYIRFKGFAGTGKTFTLASIIRAYKEQFPTAVVAMTAPTHKAVKQLKKNASGSKNALFGTIHSLLGLKERIDSKTGNRTFENDNYLSKQSKIDEASVLIVDEASMLPKDLFQKIMNYQASKKDINLLKIIFTGDPKQLPPVNETFSSAFISHPLYNSEEYILSQPMRQTANSNILSFATAIRDTQGDVSYKHFLGDDLLQMDTEHFQSEILPMFGEPFDLDSDHIKVLAYTNEAVRQMNQLIRQYRLQEACPPKIVAGDFFVADDPIFDMKHPLKPIIISNSEELLIEECTKVEVPIRWNVSKSLQEIRTELRVKAVGEDEIAKELWVDNAIKKGFAVTSSVMSYTFFMYKCNVIVYRLNDNMEEVPYRYTVYVIHEDSEAYFKQVIAALEQIAHKAYDRTAAWREFYNFQKLSASISPNYALTIHKSQGSTYKNCVLLMDTVDSLKRVVNGVDTKLFERTCLRYVGVSRAKEKLFIL
jgi:exodeoxyribonuclease-5